MSARHAVAALALALPLAACADGAPPASADPRAEERARAEAQAFLDRYVDPDGRVVRRDQGGDTVSEGQAYGLLLAEVVGDEAAADRIWTWADANLRRPDGLLSYLTDASGAVRDPQSAADADLLAAWALARSGELEQARRLADAVLEHEVVRSGDAAVVSAGPWATPDGIVNPSYWSPGPYAELARRLDDPRWAQLVPDAVAVLRDLTDDGRVLPPDWGRVQDGEAVATGSPGGQTPGARYSLDAQRTVVWLAVACSAEARALAASWRPLLQDAAAGASALGTDGTVLEAGEAPLAYVASAAAAHADGDTAARDQLLERASATAERFPGYYGHAWSALGRALLQTDLLDPCEESA